MIDISQKYRYFSAKSQYRLYRVLTMWHVNFAGPNFRDFWISDPNYREQIFADFLQGSLWYLTYETCMQQQDMQYCMVHTGLTTFYSRTFPGLFQDFLTTCKESVSIGTPLHIFHSHFKKAIPVSANNVVQPKDNNYSCVESFLQLFQHGT